MSKHFTFVWCNRIIPSDRYETLIAGKDQWEATKILKSLIESTHDIPKSDIDILEVFPSEPIDLHR